MEAVESTRHTHRLILSIGDFLDPVTGRGDAIIVNVDGIAERPQISYQGLGRRLTGAVGKRSDGGVNGIHAQLRAKEIGQWGQAGQGVGVYLQRDIFSNGAADSRDKGSHAVRSEQSAGVLQHDAVDVGAFKQLLRLLLVELIGVHWAKAVGQRTKGLSAKFLGKLEALVNVVDVIEPIKRTNDTEAVGIKAFSPVKDGIIRQEVKGC